MSDSKRASGVTGTDRQPEANILRSQSLESLPEFLTPDEVRPSWVLAEGWCTSCSGATRFRTCGLAGSFGSRSPR